VEELAVSIFVTFFSSGRLCSWDLSLMFFGLLFRETQYRYLSLLVSRQIVILVRMPRFVHIRCRWPRLSDRLDGDVLK
jgi:hypothetical protein